MRFIFLFAMWFCMVAGLGGLVAQDQSTSQDLIIEVKAECVAAFATSQQIRVNGIGFRLEPLLENSSRFQKNWFLARPDTRTAMSAWDLAHQVVANNPDVVYAEPDEASIATYNEQSNQARGCEEDGYNEEWGHPGEGHFSWHLEDTHSQLRSARQADSPNRIRIAHFDTGYDPKFIAMPKYLRTDLQRNFIEGEDKNSAVDLGSEGLLNQPGHGTSTISILAGNHVRRPQNNFDDYVGGAPFAEVVPIRLSRSVVLYKTSAFVKALYYIMDINCDVVSMSMGGVASEYWAKAVNDAYDHGIVLVTAAGNNFGRLPTTNLVFPARFQRVIGVCGVTYNLKPYFQYELFEFKMQGNYGPSEVMTYAMAAYTPNILWAKMGCVDKFSVDGGGTSAATPQIAAAAALWLQKYRDFRYDHPWQRVNAVRHALFSSAYKGLKDSKKYYGNGVLKANAALQVQPILDSNPVPKDEVSFPIWTILFGSRAARQKMYEVEFLRLEHNNRTLQQIFATIGQNQQVTAEQKRQIKETVAAMPEASQAIRQLLEQM